MLLAACNRTKPIEVQGEPPIPAQLEPAPELRLPVCPGAPGSNLLTDAVQVWFEGAAYIARAEDYDFQEPKTQSFFAGITWETEWFLESPRVLPPVRLGCAECMMHEEATWEDALDSRNPLLRLQALVLLISVRASRSIRDQWRVLNELEQTLEDPLAQSLLASIRAEFRVERLRPLLELKEPKLRARVFRSARSLPDLSVLREEQPSPPIRKDAYWWALRAVGVAKVHRLIPYLATAATSKPEQSRYAAVLSLEELGGDAADAALMQCVLAWQSSGSEKAARVLLERNPELLERNLLSPMAAPESERLQDRATHLRALFLGRLGNPTSTTDLCEQLIMDPGVASEWYLGRHARIRVRAEMFDLVEKLATEDHRMLIDSLPDHVAEANQERAEEVRQNVFERLNRR